MKEDVGPPEAELNALKQKLSAAEIDTSTWGTGEAKQVKDLYEEIKNGETVLTTDDEGRLLRQVTVCGANVYYIKEGKTYRLKEEKQVFADGRERRRTVPHSVSEKAKPNEDPNDGIIRGLREELGIKGEIALTPMEISTKRLSSRSYPGLQSQYVTHAYEVILTDEQYNPNGYIEVQEDKTTYFVWEEVREA
jgi:hypothetical protein